MCKFENYSNNSFNTVLNISYLNIKYSRIVAEDKTLGKTLLVSSFECNNSDIFNNYIVFYKLLSSFYIINYYYIIMLYIILYIIFIAACNLHFVSAINVFPLFLYLQTI